MILLGTFRTNHRWAAVATLGVIFGAVYMLMMLRKVLFGPIESGENRVLKDMDYRDWAAIIPLCLFIIVLGVYPKILLGKFDTMLANYWNTPTQSAAMRTRAPLSLPVPRAIPVAAATNKGTSL